ncbi:MAG: ribbon-helix-helix protein, CopG family [Planctomycetota bacterium]
MRTTLDLDDDLLRAAKSKAALQRKSLTKFIEEAIRRYLEPQRNVRNAFRLKLKAKKGRPLPGVDLADRDSLYERMEGRP